MNADGPSPAPEQPSTVASLAGASAPRIADYTLLRRVGRGAYGEVWLARGVTGAFRAVKVIRRDRFADAEPFEREFRGLTEACAGTVGAAGQVALLHASRNETEGFFYYVMEAADDAVSGRDIHPELYVPLTLKELRARNGRVPVSVCITFGVELARGLAALHSRGLVHRDVKPSNVILVEGRPKLADIGLLSTQQDATTLIGTPGFIPPEGPGTPAADVFALGKVLYELATGFEVTQFPRLPPDSFDAAERRRLLQLNEVLLRACDPSPTRRYRDGASLLADLAALQPGTDRRPRRPSRMTAAAGALAVAALVAVVVAWWPDREARIEPAASLTTEPAVGAAAKAVAVLPFENLSSDPEHAYFADGLQEEVITRLGRIGELRVLSRGSVLQYRTTTKTVRQIGIELGVTYVLRGSVGRAGERAHVAVQLVDVRTEAIAWSETFDRKLQDVFAVQAEITTAVATALNAKLTSREARLVARRGTTNMAAYEAFARATAISGMSVMGYSEARLAERAAWLYRAVALDPEFAEAWAALATCESDFAWVDGDPAQTHAGSAQAALAQAQKLAPDLPDVEMATAYFEYHTRDYARAAARWERLRRIYPNNASIHYLLGLTLRRQDRWAEALASARKAAALEPANTGFVEELSGMLCLVRRWREALALRQVIAATRPDELGQQWALATLEWHATGSPAPLETFLRNMPADRKDTVNGFRLRKMIALFRGEYAEFVRLDLMVREMSPEVPTSGATTWLEMILGALTLQVTGDPDGARARLGALPQVLRAQLAQQPENARVLSYLGWVEVINGHPAAAEQYANRAVAAMPATKDALDHRMLRLDRAGMLAWIGEKDRALAELADLFKYPTPDVDPPYTRVDVGFVPLHGDPRFEALLSDPRNSAPLF